MDKNDREKKPLILNVSFIFLFLLAHIPYTGEQLTNGVAVKTRMINIFICAKNCRQFLLW